MKLRTSRQRGATLVEMVIVIVIVSIALVAVVNALSGSAGRSADPLWQYKTLKLAQLYMDEILSKAYDETTPPGGVNPSTTVNCGGLGPEEGSRDDFDDVDDFIVTNAVPDIVTSSSIAMDTTYANYRISISVTCAGAELGLSASNGKRIQLVITPPGGMTNIPKMEFTAYKGNY